MPNTMFNILGRFRSKTYPLLNDVGYQQLEDEDPIEDQLNYAGTADGQPSANEAEEEQAPLVPVSQNDSYDSLADALQAAEEVIKKEQASLDLFTSEASKILAQINTELDNNSMAILYTMLGKESLLNVIETALEFKHNYESWLKKLGRLGTFTAIAQTIRAITSQVTQKKKDIKLNKLNKAVAETVAATIEHIGKTLENWCLSNNDINIVKQHLDNLGVSIYKKNYTPLPFVTINDLHEIIEQFNDTLNKLESQNIKLKTAQLELNKDYLSLEQNVSAPLKDLSVALQKKITENDDEKISPLDEFLHYVIEQYLMPCENKFLLPRLHVIKHLLESGATLTEDSKNFVLDTTLCSAKTWALLGTFLRHKININNKKSNDLKSTMTQLLILCDNEFNTAIKFQEAPAQDMNHTNHFFSIFKSKHKSDDLNSRTNLPSKVANIVTSLYTETVNEKIIQEISKITTLYNKMKSDGIKKGQSHTHCKAATL